MTNLYLRTERPRGTKRLVAATALVIVLFLADIVSGGMLRHTLQRAASSFSEGVGAAARGLGIRDVFSTRASLLAQNRALSAQLAALEGRLAASAALESENEALRALVRLSSTQKGLTAPVVSSVISSPYGTFMVGAGSEDGVRQGDLVLTGDDFVIGTLGDVGSHVSVVEEVFAPLSSEDAVIGKTPVKLEGTGGGNARAEVPRDIPIREGDAAVSPRFGQRPLGVVGDVASSSARATQDVFVRLPVNLGALRFVYIVPHEI